MLRQAPALPCHRQGGLRPRQQRHHTPGCLSAPPCPSRKTSSLVLHHQHTRSSGGRGVAAAAGQPSVVQDITEKLVVDFHDVQNPALANKRYSKAVLVSAWLGGRSGRCRRRWQGLSVPRRSCQVPVRPCRGWVFWCPAWRYMTSVRHWQRGMCNGGLPLRI